MPDHTSSSLPVHADTGALRGPSGDGAITRHESTGAVVLLLVVVTVANVVTAGSCVVTDAIPPGPTDAATVALDTRSNVTAPLASTPSRSAVIPPPLAATTMNPTTINTHGRTPTRSGQRRCGITGLCATREVPTTLLNPRSQRSVAG
jgi:hypothetical protein